MVTSALGDPAGGLRKRMRGPPGFATCKPVSVPSPCWLGWLQTPEALRLGRSNAVNVQVLEEHGDRLRDPARTLLTSTEASITPSMQSMSPRSVAVPATPVVPNGTSSASHVPVTTPCGVLVPVHVPAHTPKRSADTVGVDAAELVPPPPPPPHPGKLRSMNPIVMQIRIREMVTPRSTEKPREAWLLKLAALRACICISS